MRILVDTSAWLGIEDKRDNYHAPATACWESLGRGRHLFVLSSWILEETLTLLSRRAGSERAYALGRRLLDSAQVEIIRSDPILESQSLLVMRSRHDPEFSFADATSWVIAREQNVDAVFAFDRHLLMPGILSLPDGWAGSVREKPVVYSSADPKKRPRRRRISSITARHSSSEL